MKKQFLCLAMLIPGALHAQNFEDMSAIEARIRSRTGDNGANVLIDRQLRLAKCPEEPTIEPSSVGMFVVRCAPLGWRIRVILNHRAIDQDHGAPIIQKGDTVDLTVTGTGFTLSTAAVAIDAGVAGQHIRVKTSTLSPPVTAVVAGRGSVVITR